MSPNSSSPSPPSNLQLATRNSASPTAALPHCPTAVPPRLLLLTHRFPYPPNRGDRIRSYNLLRVLAVEYSVTLGCTTDEPIGDAERQHVAGICSDLYVAPLGRSVRMARGAGAMLTGKSLTEGMFSAPQLARRVQSWQHAEPFDAVVVFCSSMFPYVDNAAFASTPKIVDLVDVDSEKWRQMGEESPFPKSWVYRREASCVRGLEQRIATQASAVTLVSDAEAELFKQTVTASCPVLGISNGVDTDYYRPAEGKPAGRSESSSIRLVFTGVLDYSPNVEGIAWFCREVLPKLRDDLDVRLQIVGRRPCKRVLDLNTLPGVTVVGEVPDVRPYLHAADIAISPLKLARGIQNKVLEAMASGLPVVLTSPSADGIAARPDVEFMIADSTKEWCQKLVQLAKSQVLRAAMGGAARQLVTRDYSWSAKLSVFGALPRQVSS